MFDAYTVKKVLPRLVIAVVLIQLSWFIFTGMITLTTAVAYGVEGLIYAPFGSASEFELDNLLLGVTDEEPTDGDTDIVSGGTGVFVAMAVAGGTALGVLGGALSLAMGALVAILIGFALLMFRQVLVVALLLVSPLALAAWILPNTEKFWKLWWESFSKLLLVFPMIVAVVAVGRVFAFITAGVDPGDPAENLLTAINLEKLLTICFVIIGFFGPFFLIPKLFALAGSAFTFFSGSVNDRSRGVFDRLKKNRQATQAQNYERKIKRPTTSYRADWQRRLQRQASNQNIGILGRSAAKIGSRVVGGYNIQAEHSAMQAQVSKELNDQIATGRDDEIRALTVNKAAATEKNGLMRVNKDGIREYKTLAGAWVDEGAVDRAHNRWGNDTYAQQTALSYEMRKAMTADQVEGISERYQTLATGPGGWGMSSSQAAGALKGAGFENQAQHLEFKHMKTDGTMDYKAFAEEAFEKKGTYALSQMSGHTIDQLEAAYAWGVANNDQAVIDQVQGVAQTFVSTSPLGGGVGQIDDQGQVQIDPAQAQAQAQAQAAAVGGDVPKDYVQVNAPAPGAVAQRVRQFAINVGVYQTPPGKDERSIGPYPHIPLDK